jgi:hypothetical protein
LVSQPMRRLVLRATIFSLPFILLTAFVAAVDPFDCLRASSLVSESVKSAAAEPLHNALWKVQKFKRSPVSRLILGDSSMASIKTEEIRSLTGQDYFNFAYGGGTLIEAIDTYRYAAANTHLDAVYLGVGIINFNEYQNLDRVPEAEAMVASPLKYLTNRIVVMAAFISAYSAYTGQAVSLGAPAMSHDAFWQKQINESLLQLLYEYHYPDAVAAGLERMAADCRRHGTQLIFIIPPTHVDLQTKVVALGRGGDVARFKAFVATLGTVYDLDYPNAFTSVRENFADPFHTMRDDMLVREVWGDGGQYSRRTAPR